MKKRFILSTARRTRGTLGYHSTSPLEEQVDKVIQYHPEDIWPLTEAIEAELPKARAQHTAASAGLRGEQRGTRSGAAAGARYNRAYYKVQGLTEALEKLDAARKGTR